MMGAGDNQISFWQGRWSPTCQALLFSFLALVYLAGINPHMLPESTDDIVYFEMAESWSLGLGHRFQNEVIGDWPPVYPLYLALPMLLGLKSLLLAKLMTVASAVGGLWCISRLCLAERREPVWLLVMLTGLLTMSCLFAVRPAGDWLFVILSFLFLLVLRKLDGPQRWRWALLAGLLLGAASLTRFVGVLLGAAIISQGIARLVAPSGEGTRREFKDRLFSLRPELLATLIGGGLWLSWSWYLARVDRLGQLARGNYDHQGLSLWAHLEPHRLFFDIGSALFQSGNLLEKLGLAGTPVEYWVSAAIALLLVTGMVVTLRRGLWQPADAYGLATVLLILPYQFKVTRYWFVVAPILLSWIFRGVSALAAPLRKRWPAFPWLLLRRGMIASWIGVLLVAWTLYCWKGNGADHRGLNWFAAGDADQFYLGRNADLRRACIRIDQLWPDARIGVEGWFTNYTHWFSGGHRSFRHDYYPNAFDTFICITQDPLPARVAQDFSLVFTEGAATVYRQK